MMTLAQALALLPGATLVGAPGDPALEFSRVHSDTRSLRPGDLFVALRGERFDAHDFLVQARDAGAVAALAERGLAAAGLPGLEVPNAHAALQDLAGAWRRRFHLPLIAVTGSNGKTTVTQMIASILRAWLGEGAFATEGNLNNHIGLPLTLLRLRQDDGVWHRAGVVELGMNHPGEIALLAALAAPGIALVNNAQREHQEFMHSVEAVARENGRAIEALGPAGTAVFPADDEHAPVWRAQAGTRPVLTFALDGDGAGTREAASHTTADVTGDALWQQAAGCWALELRTPAGEARAELHIAGRHNAKNALAAAAAALAAGAPLAAIARGLSAFRPVKGRSQTGTLQWRGRAAALVDDSYNANPDSVLAAIEVLADLPGPRWLLLGDMGEVGDRGPGFHAEAGARALERGIEHLWCAGPLGEHAVQAQGPGRIGSGSARHFATAEDMIAALPQGPEAASVLVKGSRFMAMERVVKALQAGGGHAA